MFASRILIAAAAAALVCVASASARADDLSPPPDSQASPAATPMNPIVVTATRIPEPAANIGTTVTVVDDAKIDDQKIDRVEDALREVPGVIVTATGSPGTNTDVSIRGATSAQTLVMVDGVEVNAGATGQFNFGNFPTQGVDRIEILRGAGGALYGSEAIGGVINVISDEGTGTPRATLTSLGGTRATSNQIATFSGSQGALGYAGSLSYFSTEGYHQFNDNSDAMAGNIRLDYHLGENTTMRGFARYIGSNVSLPTFSIFSGSMLNTTAHERGEFMLFKGEVEHKFSDRLVARASASFVRDDQRINSTPYAGNSSSEQDRVPDEIRGFNAEAVYTWAEGWRTLAGFDFKDRWARSNSISVFPPFGTFVSLFRSRRQEYAGYVEQEARLLDGHILATGGVRVDGNSVFGIEVSPAWSVAVPIEKLSTTLRGSYSEGFRAPSFNDLYFPGFGNPNLLPEISSEYDGGFTSRFGSYGSLTSTYFSRRVRDLIVAVPSPTSIFGSIAGNAGRVDVQGIEIVPMATPFAGFEVGGYVTILDETHANATGATARPLRVPKHSAAALVQYERRSLFSDRDRALVNVRYVFVGDRDDITVAATIRNHQAYNRVDAVASYSAGMRYRHMANEEVFARVINAIDRRYSEAFGFPAPSVTFSAGVKLDFD